MNIALFGYGVGNIKGGGGAERFFADFFEAYHQSDIAKFNLYFILDTNSISNLNQVNKLNSRKNILPFKIFSNRFKDRLESLQLAWLIVRHKIRIIHIPLYNRTYIPILKRIDRLPSFIRPEIIINIVNACVPEILLNATDKRYQSYYNTYMPLFKEVHVDGYFCWNQSFVDYVNKANVFTDNPKKIKAIQSRFSDTKKFTPRYPKKKTIIFAGRLVTEKKPDWFIEAAHILTTSHPDEIKGWCFILLGDGELRNQLEESVKSKNMGDTFSMKIEGDISNHINSSMIYVSCQDCDNFPSLSMAEAMSAGNAIVARNLGQTNLFVISNHNGLIIQPDSPSGLADALLKLVTNKELTEEMGKKSIELMKNVHTIPNFIRQIDAFWESFNPDNNSSE